MNLPTQVRIVEVGPRDGLQNERVAVSTDVKLELIDRLGRAGLREIEATAFVAPRWVPQMADHAELMTALPRRPGVRYPVLVPNLKGLEAALRAGAREVAIFPAATESFSRRNLNCSVAESLARCSEVTRAALAAGVTVRGYISCALGCPFEGKVAAERVAEMAEALLLQGCSELSLGDTIGAGTPGSTWRLWEAVLRRVPVSRVAGHFHDTGGMAVANILASLQIGVAIFDSSVAGLGGCPYAPGASGNVATEDVLFLLDGLGIETGIDPRLLAEAGDFISAAIGRVPAVRSRALRPAQALHSEASSA